MAITLHYDVVNAQVAASSDNADNYLIVTDVNPEKKFFILPPSMGGKFTNIYLSGKNIVDVTDDDD